MVERRVLMVMVRVRRRMVVKTRWVYLLISLDGGHIQVP